MERVLVFGTFDHFHPGHRHFLEEAESHGELFVVVARDSNVEKIKGRAAEESQEERLKVVQEAFAEAHVMLGDPTDFLAPLRAVKPSLVLLGYDQKLPPGVREEDIPCAVERAEPFEAEYYKSSLLRGDE